mgnify:CR=1 FL=1
MSIFMPLEFNRSNPRRHRYELVFFPDTEKYVYGTYESKKDVLALCLEINRFIQISDVYFVKKELINTNKLTYPYTEESSVLHTFKECFSDNNSNLKINQHIINEKVIIEREKSEDKYLYYLILKDQEFVNNKSFKQEKPIVWINDIKIELFNIKLVLAPIFL